MSDKSKPSVMRRLKNTVIAGANEGVTAAKRHSTVVRPYADEAINGVLKAAKAALRTKAGKNAATGAASGAVIGAALPFVTIAAGAMVGAALLVMWRAAKAKDD